MLSKFRGMGRGNSVPSKRAHADGLPVEQLEERRLLAATTTGVDPANMGKGDFIVSVPATMKNLTADTELAMAQTLKAAGFRWIAVDAGDGDDGPLLNYGDGKGLATVGSFDQFSREFIDTMHSQDIKVFGVHTVYGGSTASLTGATSVASIEPKVGKDILSLGADGLIIDAETDFENVANNATAASTYGSAIRAAFPTTFLALDSFAYVSQHSKMPYSTFAKYVDVMMPQDYWATLSDPNGSPSKMVSDMDSQWKGLYDGFRNQGHPEWVRPIVPIGQGSNTNTVRVSSSAVSTFFNALKNDATPASPGGYNGVGFFSLEVHTPDVWKGVVNNDIGSPGGVVFGTVFSDVNGDALQSHTVEHGALGWTVYADDNNNGQLDSNEIRATTDINGNFRLFWLPAGDHVIRVQMPNTSWRVTTQSSFTVTVLEHLDTLAGSFGVTNNPWMHGVVFNDTNADGIRQPTERPVKNVFIWADLNHDGKHESKEPSTVANSKGRYNLTLGVGDYQVREILPKGFRLVLPTKGYQAASLVAHGAGYEGFNFADTTTVLIKGTVFSDTNHDGIKQSSESVLPSRMVYLDLNGDGKFDDDDISTNTRGNGSYRFAVAPGSYQVRVNFGKAKVAYTAPAGGAYVLNLKSGRTATGRDFGVVL